MLQDYSKYRVLQLFFDSPTKRFYLREISRILRLGLPSVRNHVEKLHKEGLIKKEVGGIYPSYIASTDDELFKAYKRNDILVRFRTSGLADFLVDNLTPDAIVLFGSASHGEDVESSDVDLLIVSKEKRLNVVKFEKCLNHKLSLRFEPDVSEIPKELLNNVINGIVVYGYLKVFQ